MKAKYVTLTVAGVICILIVLTVGFLLRLETNKVPATQPADSTEPSDKTQVSQPHAPPETLEDCLAKSESEYRQYVVGHGSPRKDVYGDTIYDLKPQEWDAINAKRASQYDTCYNKQKLGG